MYVFKEDHPYTTKDKWCQLPTNNRFQKNKMVNRQKVNNYLSI